MESSFLETERVCTHHDGARAAYIGAEKLNVERLSLAHTNVLCRHARIPL